MKHLFILLGCLVASNTFAAVPMKVMTFNIRWGNSPEKPSEQQDAWIATSGLHRRDLALQVVSERDPDILCLQEALKHQIADLHAALPGHAFYGVGRDDGAEQGEYSGIFYRRDRFAEREVGTFWLNKNPDQPGTKFPKTCCARLASWVILQDLRDSNREFFLLNTHWDHQVQEARLFSAQLIRKYMKTLACNRPILLTGDLNVTTENPAFQLLVNATPANRLELLDSYRETHSSQEKDKGTFHTFHGNDDGKRIDYILHGSKFRVQNSAIVRMHDQGRYPSDHFPVTATVILAD